jgi:hypothetical protein
MSLSDRILQLRKDIRYLLLCIFYPDLVTADKIRQDLNKSLRSHWPDQSIEAYELIFESWENDKERVKSEEFKEYVVFIDSELDVDWIYDGSIPGKAGDCISMAESIGAKRCKHLPKEQILEFRRLIGQAIVNGIRGNVEQACKLAIDAGQFLRDRTIERSRSWTLLSAHVLFVILAFSVATLEIRLTSIPNFSATPSFIWFATIGGLLGAYLSLIQKAGVGHWDAASGLWMHALEAFTKLIAGCFLGVIAYSISRSVHAPEAIKILTPDAASLFLFGLAAGTCERLIPKMISAYSENYQRTNQQS